MAPPVCFRSSRRLMCVIGQREQRLTPNSQRLSPTQRPIRRTAAGEVAWELGVGAQAVGSCHGLQHFQESICALILTYRGWSTDVGRSQLAVPVVTVGEYVWL